MSQLRILVADDNQIMQAAYKQILETDVGLEVVWIASDGEEAVEKYMELAPDVAILDVRMPKIDGLAAANRIIAGDSPTAIVLVSAYDDLAFVRAIMHSGASGKAYLLKSSLTDITGFIRVVKAVANGQSVLDKSVIQSLMERYHCLNVSAATPLSETEEAVLELMLEGFDESEIAQTLDLPAEQVEVLAGQLCEKLGLDVRESSERSSQAVQAIVNLCIP